MTPFRVSCSLWGWLQGLRQNAFNILPELPFRVHFLLISLPIFISGAVITFMRLTLPLVTSHLSVLDDAKVLSSVILVPRLRAGNESLYAVYESGSEKRLQRFDLSSDNAAKDIRGF